LQLGYWLPNNPNRNYRVPDNFRFGFGSASSRPEISGTRTEILFGSGTRPMNTPTQYRLDQNETKLRLMEDKLLLHPDSPRLNEWIHRLLRQREKLLLFNQKY